MIGMVTKQMYFTAAPVKAAMDKVTRLALGYWAGDVKRAAVRSIKPAPPGTYSQPGAPPFSHVAWRHRQASRASRKAGLGPLPRLKGKSKGIQDIQFGRDIARRSNVVGIMPIPGRPAHVGPLLEYGGSQMITSRGKRVRAHYAARPMMGPAEAEIRPTVNEIWKRASKKAFK